MNTRSRLKKSFATEYEDTKPSITKGKTSTIESKTSITVNNDEANVSNAQLPVFNIHIHVPPMTSDSNKSYQCQPAIHVHVGELVKTLGYGALSEKVERPDKTSEVELPLGRNSNSNEHSNSLENKLLEPLKKNKSRSMENSANLETENSEAVVSPMAKTQENEDAPRNSYKNQLSTRRSIRQANSRKLLQSLKDLDAKETSTTKAVRKSCRNIKIEDKLSSIKQTLNLKEPVVVLNDISKLIKNGNFTFCVGKINEEQDGFGSISRKTFETYNLEKIERISCDSLGESHNEQNSGNTEKIDNNLKKTPNDQNLFPVNENLGEIFSHRCSSDKRNSANNVVTDFADKCIFSDNLKVNLKNKAEPEKCVYKTPFDAKNNFVKDTENNQGNDIVPLQLEKHKVTEKVKNDKSNLSSKDVPLNLNNSDGDDGTSVSLNSKNSSDSCDDYFGSDDSGSDFSQTADFDEGIHQNTSLTESDNEPLNVSLKSKNNLLKNTIEEIEFSSTESDKCKEINVKTLGFQLKLIKKEMKKRDMVKKESRRKKSLKREAVSQIAEEESEGTPTKAKKMKLSKEITKSVPAANNSEKSSTPEDYIPLQVSGPTKFAVAQLSKVKPCSEHKAKNFKNEMLFGKRVNRYSDPKHLQMYLLKKQAAKLRKK